MYPDALPIQEVHMRLKAVEILNFRSIEHLQIHTGAITTVIGRNNAGKSNVLRAINAFFFASDRALELQDISKFSDDRDSTWIECTFEELNDNERRQLAQYVLHDGTVRIRRTLEYKEGALSSFLHGWLEEPNESWLRSDFADYGKTATWKTVDIDPFDYAERPPSGRVTKAAFEDFRARYIEEHKESLTFDAVLFTTQLLGRQSTALSVLPQVTFIPATGDVTSQIVGRSSSLLNMMILEIVKGASEKPEYQRAHEALQTAQHLINPSSQRLHLITAIEEALQAQLQSWGSIRCHIRTSISDLAKVLLEGLELALDDGTETGLAQKGEGIQRQVLFQVFRLYADYKSRRGIFKDLTEESDRDKRSHVIIFEEPELFLHPQAQESFYDDLVDVSQADQVLLATHSNHLLRLEHADGLVILRRAANDKPTKAFIASVEWLDNEDERQRLKDIHLLNSDVAKMFFADKIILVEGVEEYIYIVGTAQSHASCFNRRIAVVQCGGKDNIPRLQRVLNGFQIPYIAAYDTDPDNEQSQRTTATIINLVREARSTGTRADICEFDPTTAKACGNDHVNPNDKVFSAYKFIREETPEPDFRERITSMYAL